MQNLKAEAEAIAKAGASQTEQLIAELESVKTDLEKAKSDAGAQDGVKSELEASQAEAVALAKELDGVLKTAAADKEASAAENDRLQTKVKELEASVSEAAASKEASAAAASEMEAKVKELEASASASVAAKASSEASVQAKLKEIEAAAASEASKLQAKITELEASVLAAVEAKKASDAEMSKMQAKVLGLEASSKAKEEQEAGETGGLRKRLAELETLVGASDVQALLTARKATIDGMTVVQDNAQHYYTLASNHTADAYTVASEHTAVAYKLASEHTAVAYALASEHTAVAYEISSKLAEEYYDHVVNNVSVEAVAAATAHYDQTIPVVMPHIETATGHFVATIDFLTAKISIGVSEAADRIPALAPHAKAHGHTVAVVGAYTALLLPFGCVFLLMYFAIVRRMAMLLAKLEFALLFVLFGGVAAVCALAFATGQDPVGALRASAFEKYMLGHYVAAAIGATLVIIQASVRGRYLSLVAGVMTSALFGHYYIHVYKKSMSEPGFQIPFELKADGSASFGAYMLKTTAVVLVSAFATPSSFRYSSRALLMALEGAVAGALLTLWVLDGTAVRDAIGASLRPQYAPHVGASVVGLLALVLVYRFLTSLGVFSRFVVTLAHMGLVGSVLRPIVQIQYRNFVEKTVEVIPKVVMLKCAVWLLILLGLQVLLQIYATELQMPKKKAPAKPMLPKKVDVQKKKK